MSYHADGTASVPTSMDLPQLKPRPTDAHKGNFGRALIIAGSRGMTGAACLAGFSAVKSGAGLVTVAVPNRCLETIASYNPCYMTVPFPDDDVGRFKVSKKQISKVYSLCEKSTSIGIGPGLSASESIEHFVHMLYALVDVPMVVDADALNAMAKVPSALKDHGHKAPRILTPHIGEFRRLAEDPSLTPAACRDRAKELAAQHRVVIVLKGHRTLVTNGESHYENDTGNPGMATGGSGDVLTGVITALLGQGYSPMDAACLGVHAHGLAGDLARDCVGHEMAVSAEDIARQLGHAFARL